MAVHHNSQFVRTGQQGQESRAESRTGKKAGKEVLPASQEENHQAQEGNADQGYPETNERDRSEGPEIQQAK